MKKFLDIPEQIEIAEQVKKYLETYDNVVLSAPTGTGKSAIAYQIHNAFYSKNRNYKSLILNHQNNLISQYDELLGNRSGVVSIKGKDNYTCFITKDPVSESHCDNSDNCPGNKYCTYYQKRKRFKDYPLGVTNYQLVLSLIDVGHYKRVSDLMICDEAHNIEDIIVDYRTVKVDRSIIDVLNKNTFNYKKLGLLRYQDYLRDLEFSYGEWNSEDYLKSFQLYYQVLSNFLVYIRENVFSDKDARERLKKMYSKDFKFASVIVNTYHSYVCKYKNFLKTRKGVKYVYEEKELESSFEYSLTPLHISNLYQNLKHEIANKAVYMSATVTNKKLFMKELGLKEESTVFVDVSSKFPKENRKVFFLPVAKLNYFNSSVESKEFQEVCETALNIIEEHSKLNHSGVIFVPSYSMAKNFRNYVGSRLERLGFLVVMNSNAGEREGTLVDFTDVSLGKRLLISPSFNEGVNFTGDISNFQIILKVPYLSLSTNRIKLKAEIDNVWYQNKAMTTLIQMSGRSVRNEKDFATTYVLDSNGLSLYKNNINNVPDWYKEAVTCM